MSAQATFATALLDARVPLPPGLIDAEGRPAHRRFDVYRNNVAVSYAKGWGVEQDQTLASASFDQACTQGHASAPLPDTLGDLSKSAAPCLIIARLACLVCASSVEPYSSARCVGFITSRPGNSQDHLAQL